MLQCVLLPQKSVFRNWLLEIWLISLAEIEIGCWHEAGPISLICRAAGAKKFLESHFVEGSFLFRFFPDRGKKTTHI